MAWSELKRRIPFTRQYVMILEKLGRFPKRIQIGVHRVAWLEHEIDEWIEARAREREVDQRLDDRAVGRAPQRESA